MRPAGTSNAAWSFRLREERLVEMLDEQLADKLAPSPCRRQPCVISTAPASAVRPRKASFGRRSCRAPWPCAPAGSDRTPNTRRTRLPGRPCTSPWALSGVQTVPKSLQSVGFFSAAQDLAALAALASRDGFVAMRSSARRPRRRTLHERSALSGSARARATRTSAAPPGPRRRALRLQLPSRATARAYWFSTS